MQTLGERKCELESENESASEMKIWVIQICIWGNRRAEAGGTEQGSAAQQRGPQVTRGSCGAGVRAQAAGQSGHRPGHRPKKRVRADAPDPRRGHGLTSLPTTGHGLTPRPTTGSQSDPPAFG